MKRLLMSGKRRRRSSTRHDLSRADKRRRGRRYGMVILGLPALVLAFYLVDRSGPLETIAGMVIETSSYPHSGTDSKGEHTHVRAILEFDGHRYKLDRAGRFRQGDQVSVEVHRGRLTGYAYFVQAW